MLCGLVGVGFGCASQRPSATVMAGAPYVRVRETPEGLVQLEIAARRLLPRRGTGPTLWLTGASHLGEGAYYRALQTHLDERTLVLFEGVCGPEAPRGPTRAQEQATVPPQPVSMQAQLARSLGLEFQLEVINYDRPHFRNSDLTVAELRELMSAGVAGATGSTNTSAPARAEAARNFERLLDVMQGESFLGRLMNLGLRWLGTQPRYQALAKFTLIETLNGVQGDFESLGALPPAMQELLRVLIAERNQRVVSDLRRELPHLRRTDSVSIFYGAGHMRDLETRLCRELHYEVQDQIWFPALTVNPTAAGLSPAELATTRAMIQQQLATLRQRTPAAR